jgi:hypothetical protein
LLDEKTIGSLAPELRELLIIDRHAYFLYDAHPIADVYSNMIFTSSPNPTCTPLPRKWFLIIDLELMVFSVGNSSLLLTVFCGRANSYKN